MMQNFKKVFSILMIAAFLNSGFFISNVSADGPSLTVTSPNGGNILTVGQNYHITWISTNVSTVNIGYSSCDSCLTWIATNIGNTGSYDWNVNVGNTTNTQFKIEIIGYETGVGSVTDLSDNFFTVNPSTISGLTITTSSLPNAKVGTFYGANISATGGSSSNYNWTFSSGSVPAGLSICATSGFCQTASGTTSITGTPTAAGTYTFGIGLTSGSLSTSKQFTLTVDPVSTTSIAITTPSPLPNAKVGTFYSSNIIATGGSSYNWTVSSGSLPPGLSICASTGFCQLADGTSGISGTPTTAGNYTFTVTVTSGSQTASKQFSLTVLSSTSTAPTITSLSPTSGAVGTQVTITGSGFNVNGGCSSTTSMIVCTNSAVPPNTVNFGPSTSINNLYSTNGSNLSFTVPSFTHPSCLDLVPSCAIMSAQIIPGTYSVSVTNNSGTSNAVSFTVTDGSTSTLAITTTSPLPDAKLGSTYATTISGSGGSSTYSWSIQPNTLMCVDGLSCGSLPPGLTLSQIYPPCAFTNVCPSQALISGTATTAGTYSFGFTLASGSQSVSKQFSLTVDSGINPNPPPPQPTPPPPPPVGNVKPIGWLDSISADGVIAGWALDKNHPDQSVNINIYFDGPAGVGTNQLTTTANLSRGDVDQVMQVSGDHGFSAQIPSALADGKAHTAYVYAVDLDDSSGASNAQLYGSPRTFTLGTSSSPRHPRGTLVIDPAGTVFFLGTTLRYAFPSPEIFFSWGNKFSYIVLANDGDLAMPVGPVAQLKP